MSRVQSLSLYTSTANKRISVLVYLSNPSPFKRMILVRISGNVMNVSMCDLIRRTGLLIAILSLCTWVAAQEGENEGTDPVGSETTTGEQIASSDNRAPATIPIREIEDEIIVTGEPVRITPAMTILDIYDAHNRGGYYYRLRMYERAYPYLKEAAKSGFKESQARLGFIYQQGLGGVERNWIEAVGWLGVAASKTSRPEIINYWKRLYKRIPEERHEMIDHIVEVYTKKYGSEATGVICDMNRPAGSHIKKMRCYFEDEIEYRDPFGELFPGVEIDTSVGGGGGPGI